MNTPHDAGEGSQSTASAPPAAVQSVDRALLVLEILAKYGSAGVTEIADELGVHKSTISRLIGVLETRGYVEQLSGRGKYRLGFSIVRLAGSTAAQLDLAKLGQAICDRLADKVGETTNLAVFDRGLAVNVVEANGPSGISLRTWVGQSSPAHATSSGKALLSGLTSTATRRELGESLQKFTDNTITDYRALDAELDGVRLRGWACVTEELEVGLNAVSAPVRDASSDIVAALSVSGPAYRLLPSRFETIANSAVESAVEISRKLGYSGLIGPPERGRHAPETRG